MIRNLSIKCKAGRYYRGKIRTLAVDLPESMRHCAMKTAGVSCVIAETFARIFYRNAINIGLPIIECPEAARGIEAGDEVEVDFDSGMIYNQYKRNRI